MNDAVQTSIKTILPELGQILRLEPGWLYERQRALVRRRLIAVRPGRGPGSGALATPRAVAMLLISLLASDGLNEAVSGAAQLAKSPPQFGSGPKKCPITGKSTLIDAFATTLSSAEQVQKLHEIVVSRQTLVGAMVWWPTTKKHFTVNFSNSENPSTSGLQVRAALSGFALVKIEQLIRKDGAPA